MTPRGSSGGIARRELLAGGAALAGGMLAPATTTPVSARVNGVFGVRATAAGMAELRFEEEGGRTIDPNLAWHLGSNTKAITALLYAVLVEDGACRWGATLGELFPDMDVHRDLAAATVEELMAHAAGLTDQGINGMWLMARRMDHGSPAAQRQAFAREWLGRAPTAPRGRFAYANANYIVLGAAIERIMAMNWEEGLRRRVFAPLGIEGAGFGAPCQRELWGRHSSGETWVPADPEGLADNPAVFGPAGTVHMAPAEYARLLSLYLRGGAPLLRKKTLSSLLSPPSPNLRYAGGWGLVGEDAALGWMLMHDGSNTLWYARALIDPAAGFAYAAGTNRGGDAGREAVERMLAAMRVDNL